MNKSNLSRTSKFVKVLAVATLLGTSVIFTAGVLPSSVPVVGVEEALAIGKAKYKIETIKTTGNKTKYEVFKKVGKTWVLEKTFDKKADAEEYIKGKTT